MAVSDTIIANMALSRVGHDPILSLDENTRAGRTCKLHFEPVRDAILEAHPWNFCIRRAALAQENVTPAFEYSYQYVLPTDFLRIVRTSIEALSYGGEDYRIEYADGHKVLLSNDSSVSIEYVARVGDVGLWSPTVVDLFADRLAAEICFQLTNDAGLATRLFEKYQAKLLEARHVDSQQGTARPIIDDTAWLRARL